MSMKYAQYYEKLNSVISMDLFGYKPTLDSIENDFSIEYMYLINMTLDIFSREDDTSMFEILRLYDVYYRNGKPLINDSFYEGLNKAYHTKTGSTLEVIMFEPIIDAWEKCEHDMSMGSLDKQATIEEIEKWNAKKNIQGKPSVLSEKLDGISLESVYEKGKFVRAVTRGDGKEGSDITQNAIYFDGMVKELREPWDCSIRGEVVITKSNLIKINKILEKEGKEPLKNTRNGASGLATKFKDRNEEILSLLTFIAYDVQVFKVYETNENVI
jgi:DNA ligase (NAD+)